MMTAGYLGLVVLTSVFRYPTSMIGVPGDERWNTDPPSFALVMVTLWLVGLVLVAKPALDTWLDRAVPGRLVTMLNGVALTMYLWHVTAITVVAAVIYPLGFPQPNAGSVQWWILRPVWITALIAALLLLVIALRRFEVHPSPWPAAKAGGSPINGIAAWFGSLSIGLGLVGFGTTGFDRIFSDAGESILAFTMNPAQNLLHVVIALGLLRAAYGLPRGATAAASLAAAVYVAIGAAGWSDGVGILAMSPENAVLHVIIGSAFLVAIAFTAIRRPLERITAR